MSQVDVAGLRKVGANVQRCAPDIAKAHTAHRGQLAAERLDGWATGAALAAADGAWTSFMSQLSGQVRDLGRNLSRAADDFEAADAAAADRVRGAGGPAGGPPR